MGFGLRDWYGYDCSRCQRLSGGVGGRRLRCRWLLFDIWFGFYRGCDGLGFYAAGRLKILSLRRRCEGVDVAIRFVLAEI